MSRRIVGRVAALAVSLFLPITLPAAAAPVAPGTRAVLEVEYVITGALSTAGDLTSTDWKVDRRFSATYEITAHELATFGTIDSGHAEAMQGDTAALGAQAQAMATDNAGMMAQVEAIMEACGDDEACIEGKIMALGMSGGAQGDIAALQADGQAMSNSTAAFDAKSPPRYQLWSGPEGMPAPGRAHASVAESWIKKDYPPICTANEVCTFIRDRAGQQDFDTAADGLSAMAMVEIDTIENRITVSIPWPMVPVDVQETTQDGTSTQTILLVSGQLLETVKREMSVVGRPIAGSYTDQGGEMSFQLPELDDYRAPIDVQVRWRFKVQ